MKRFILIFIIIVSLLTTTGCWDMIEINQRIFPYSVGVDLNDGEGEKYIITISYPNINAIGKNATQQERTYVISTIASSIFEGSAQLSSRLQYPFYFKHLRVLVLGHEVAVDGKAVRQIIDGLSRDFVINKKLRLVLAEGKAEDLLLAIPDAKRQEVIEGTLNSMLRRNRKASRFNSQTLTGFIKDSDIANVSLMPRAAAHGEDIKVFGACVFKNYGFVGHLDEEQSTAIALMNNTIKTDVVDVSFGDAILSYAIYASKSKKTLVKDGDDPKIEIDIEIEGELQEYIFRPESSLDNENLLDGMEKAIEEKLMKEIEGTIKKLQKDFNADAIGIGEYLSKFHQKIWSEISDDWEEIFPKMIIDVKIDVKIRRRGLTK